MSARENNPNNGRCRIVMTGGPGGGKTTAADLFRREIGERVVVVPESATLLFSGGFPRTDEPKARASAQCAIYHVQKGLEDVQSARYPDRILLCDRGTVDGAAYWPSGADDFFTAVGSTAEIPLALNRTQRRWSWTGDCARCGRSTNASWSCRTIPRS
jgi:predicted ATPase